MRRSGHITTGVALAGILAGPLFLVMAGLASTYRQLPAPIVVELGQILPAILLLLASAVFGSVLGLPINAIGAMIMLALAERFGWARPPIVWMLAGAALATGFVMSVRDIPPEGAFGLIATATLCAWFCRRPLAWEDDPPLPRRRPRPSARQGVTLYP